ncbi:hypothetical protein AB6E21_23320, partial [Photobacterium swingsii]|uniref:hypothetical protein n=1 Tax=Photobacterium swingsii TaxID=680026 RepID=UPI00354D84B7
NHGAEAVVQLVSLFTLKAAAYHAGGVLILGVAVYLYQVLSAPPLILSPLLFANKKVRLGLFYICTLANHDAEAVVQLVSLFSLKAAAYHAGGAQIFGVAVYLYKVLSASLLILSLSLTTRAFLCL